jgi:hypothetical protein
MMNTPSNSNRKLKASDYAIDIAAEGIAYLLAKKIMQETILPVGYN